MGASTYAERRYGHYLQQLHNGRAVPPSGLPIRQRWSVPARASLEFCTACFVAALFCIAIVLAGCKPEVGPPAPTNTSQRAPSPAPAAASVPSAPLTSGKADNPGPTWASAEAALDAPRASLAFRNDLVRTARAVWGLDAPVAVFAAQVHQESSWNPRAVSKAGAAGLAQFMPATSRWIATIDPQLQHPDPFNVGWALRAMVLYDRWLFERTPGRFSAFDRMWVALRSYNGGLGHWQAEAAASGAAQPTRQQVDQACGRAKRAVSHCPENLGYPQRILQLLQRRYLAWGPGL